MRELNKADFNGSPMIYCLSDYYLNFVLANDVDVSKPCEGVLTHFCFLHSGESLSVCKHVRARSLDCALNLLVRENGADYLNNLYGGEWLYMYEYFLSQSDLYFRSLDSNVLRLMEFGFEYGRFSVLGLTGYWEAEK